MLQLRRPTRLIVSVVVRQNARRFEVVDQELGAQTVGGDECVRFVQPVLRLVVAAAVVVVVREEFLGIVVVVGGGGRMAMGAVCIEGAVVVVGGGADGHSVGTWGSW